MTITFHNTPILLKTIQKTIDFPKLQIEVHSIHAHQKHICANYTQVIYLTYLLNVIRIIFHEIFFFLLSDLVRGDQYGPDPKRGRFWA